MDTALDLEPFEPGRTRDPYPGYARLRGQSPVCRVIRHGLTAWLLTRYDDVRQALIDPRLSTDPNHAGPAVFAVPWIGGQHALGLDRDMLRSNGATHARLRSLVGKAFTTRRVESVRPAIQARVDTLVDGFAACGEADLIEEFAFPLTCSVIMDLVGIPASRRQEFDGWVRGAVEPRPHEYAGVPQAWESIWAFLADLVTDKEHDPGDDLTSELVAVRDGTDRLSPEESSAECSASCCWPDKPRRST